jgi:predicted ribosome quality control (RQC) complex YloA/Tae2 family protein
VKNFSGSEIDITSHDQDTAKHKAGVKNFYAGKDVKGTGKEVNLQNAEDKAANATDTRTEKKANLEVTDVTKEKGEDMKDAVKEKTGEAFGAAQEKAGEIKDKTGGAINTVKQKANDGSTSQDHGCPQGRRTR